MLDKDAVKRTNPIESVMVALLHQQPRPIAGGEVAFSCPWHEDKRPSLHVNPTKNGGVYRRRAWGNVEGDVLTFVQRHQGLTFREALARLANRSGHSNGNGNGHGAPLSTNTPRPARWPQAHVLRFFDYPHADGVLARKVRYDEAVSDHKMRWIHSRDDGQTWCYSLGCDDPGLYGLEEAIVLAQRKCASLRKRRAAACLDNWPAASPPAT